LGFTSEPGWQLGLRYEYIDQDTLRNGTREVAVGEIHEHHDEVYTRNRNIIASLDYQSQSSWGVSVQVPYIQREHYHIHTHLGVPYDERWDIAALGDIRMLVHNKGLLAGLKLATGDTQQINDDGDQAERSLQPGTGTTDLLLGYTANTPTSMWDTPVLWFNQLQLQAPLADHDGYRPGTEYLINSGLVFNPSAHFNPIVQLNVVIKDRDEGTEAEADSSGGEYLWLSPGFSSEIHSNARVYGFIQLPLYQRVNGVQLTADWTATLGINWQL
jgi:hypothetical protein